MTIGHETYVNLETATLLKQAGFNWKCSYRFFNDEFEVEGNYSPSIDFNGTDRTPSEVSAPSLCVVQRWLREVKKCHVICDLSSICEPPGYSFNVFHFKFDEHGCYNIDEDYQCTVYEWYPTYEEALEAGIKKALEIILKLEERYENKQD